MCTFEQESSPLTDVNQTRNGRRGGRTRDVTPPTKANAPGEAMLRILFLATAYVVTGRLALLLAIPPGFATAIFPPVGIGLAAVLLWGNRMLVGVLLGSAILNLSIALSAGANISGPGMLIALGIAVGSTFHNATAAALIRKYIGFPTALNNERLVIGFLLIGAPLASLISATCGATVLYLAGAVGPGEYAFSWWTWWVGDGIGVLIATPLVLVFFASPHDLWRSRRNTVALPLIIGCAVMVVTFIRASRLEQEGITNRFAERAQLMTARIKANLRACSDIVMLVERFMTIAPNSSRVDFSQFSNEVRASHPELQAMSWVQRVRKDERNDYENISVGMGIPSLKIWGLNENSETTISAERDEYMVVTFIEPLELNSKIIGFDLSTDPIRNAAIVRARDNDEFILTPPVKLLQGGKGPKWLLIYPVYGGPSSNVAERRQNLRGVISAVIDPQILVENVLQRNATDDYQIRMDDITEPTNRLPVVANETSSPANPAKTTIQFEETWLFGGRNISFTALPAPSFLQKSRSLQSWVVLAGGLALCGLLGAFLLIVSGRTNHVEGLVTQRTLELSAIFDHANEAIITLNVNGYIERANPAASELFDYPLSVLLEKRITDLIPQFDWSTKPLQAGSIEIHGYRKDGTSLTLEVTSSQMEIHGRQLFTVMIHDISARKNAERLKDEFVSTVSHELRTPLTSISGSLGLICGGVVGDISEDVRELVNIARVNTDRLTLLVNDILDMEKIASGKLDVTCTKFDLRDIVRQSLVQIRGYAEQHGVSAIIDEAQFSARTAMVYADSSRLLQVMANLLSNAIKFSPKEGRVEVSLQVAVDWVKVSVRDHGPGVPADFRERVFQKFAQADGADTRIRGGTGLGLSISKALIEKFDGTIGFEDAAGGGSTFYFALPLMSSAH